MRIRALSAVMVTTAALVAGCGGSSSSSSPASSSSAAGASSSISSAGVASFASGNNCLALAGVGEKFAQASAAAVSGKAFNIQQAQADYAKLASDAPAAIQPDVQKIASAFTTFANALKNVNYTIGTIPSASQLAGLSSAVKVFSSSDLQQAEANIANWAKQNCKV